MNILQVLNAASGLFPEKVTVTLIHGETGHHIATHVLKYSELPEAFNKPTILEIESIKWRIVKAEHRRAGHYFKSARISLHVVPDDSFESRGRFFLPTLAALNELEITNEPPAFNDFNLRIKREDWLQLEFLAFENIATVQKTAAIIDSIINTADDENALLGYSIQHTRDNLYHLLEIDLPNFCSLLNIKGKGNIALSNGCFIKSGFSLQSENHIYYGIQDNGLIRRLALATFDSVDQEIADVLSIYKTLFVDWCNASVLT
ncbi:hypothetical protein [Chitinophaga filiformis]|uniref:TIGR04255 family protein n=1 Tax=Chitinophaga filiformis TaxID=104663 RepID=A0ABY4I5T2_CHIFI|nr:hypothetical protein [Chitinophaga filiformis]UPK70634.1 hypothetical protein MYF79_04895 [Chitinophaga filiformis]